MSNTRMPRLPILAALILCLAVAAPAMADTFIKKADNFIVLADTSGSMGEIYTEGKSKMVVSKDILRYMAANVPDLGYNGGLYTFTPFEAYAPMGAFDRTAFEAAAAKLPEDQPTSGFGRPTPLGRGFQELEPILDKLQGRTIIYLFSDGRNTGDVNPVAMARRLDKRYDVCFLIISTANDPEGRKILEEIARINSCSKLVPFDYAAEYPQVCTGELCAIVPEAVVPPVAPVVIIEEKKVVRANVETIHFDFDKFNIKPEDEPMLDAIGTAMKENPKATVYIAGYCDWIGSDEYNLGLSERRAKSAASYLEKRWSVAKDRITLQWYGENAPLADNQTPEGRALNRRDEIILITGQ